MRRTCIAIVFITVFISKYPEILANKRSLDVIGNQEETEFSLVAKSVPLVLNPGEEIAPPTYVATITVKHQAVGAGAIVSKDFVLTTCTMINAGEDAKMLASNMVVYYPLYDPVKYVVQNKSSAVSNVFPHSDCGTLKNINSAADIGLIQLSDPISAKHIKFPKLPDKHISEEEAQFILGNYRLNNNIATSLRESIWYVITKKVELEVCQTLIEADGQKFSPAGNLCMAYVHLGDGDYCRADIGSPVSIRYNNEDTLVGLLIHKHECGHPREIANFVCIKTNKVWIQDMINKPGPGRSKRLGKGK